MFDPVRPAPLITRRVRTTVPSDGTTQIVPELGTSPPLTVRIRVGRVFSLKSTSQTVTPLTVLSPFRVNANRGRSGGDMKNSAAVGSLKLRRSGPRLKRALSSA